MTKAQSFKEGLGNDRRGPSPYGLLRRNAGGLTLLHFIALASNRQHVEVSTDFNGSTGEDQP